MIEQPEEVLNWLCEKSERNRIYTLLRSGVICKHQDTKEFRACIELADLLSDDLETIRRKLNHFNWRYQMIGNIVVVINRDSRYENDYIDRLMGKSLHFPSPIAAGWLWIHTGDITSKLVTYLTNIANSKDLNENAIPYSNILAIYGVLRLLDEPITKGFETSELFKKITHSSYYPYILEQTENTYTSYTLLN